MALITFASCEKDDICIDDTTPHLIVRFYNNDEDTDLKAVTKLSIAIDSLGIFIPFEPTSNDSIAIPLRVDEDFTKIRLTKFTGEPNENTADFILNYNSKQLFVSRSCGYKMNFENIDISNLNPSWIANFDIIKTNIENETQAHIHIFH